MTANPYPYGSTEWILHTYSDDTSLPDAARAIMRTAAGELARLRADAEGDQQ